MATHRHHHHPRLAPGPQPKHSDAQLGDRLASILNHPLVQDPRHRAAHALLELRQEHYAADDVKRLMSAAFSDETTPADLRLLISHYLIKEFWPSKGGSEGTDQGLYNDSANFAVEGLDRHLLHLVDELGFTPLQLAARFLTLFDLKLDPETVEEIEQYRAENAEDSEDDEDEDEDDEDDEDDSEQRKARILELLQHLEKVYPNDPRSQRKAVSDTEDILRHSRHQAEGGRTQ
jgi:hypothetical protein